MGAADRLEPGRHALDGYVGGPAAPVRATALALAKVDTPAAVVPVEGISDRIALETAAVGRGRDLAAERIIVLPIGGAHAIGRFLSLLGTRVRPAGSCDRNEEAIFRRGLTAAGVDSPRTRADLAQLGFPVCVDTWRTS